MDFGKLGEEKSLVEQTWCVGQAKPSQANHSCAPQPDSLGLRRSRLKKSQQTRQSLLPILLWNCSEYDLHDITKPVTDCTAS